MNRTAKSALAIVVTLGIGVPTWVYGIAIDAEPPQAPPRDLGAVPVGLRAVEPETVLLEVTAYGNLLARERVVVAAELTARIDAVHAAWRPGNSFAAGEDLVVLDAETFRLEAETRRASAAEAAARVKTAQVELERARKALENAVHQNQVAERELERIRTLVESGDASESGADRALSAKLDRDLAEETARSAFQNAEASLVVARAGASTAAALLAQAEDRLGKARIRAPFAGRFVGRAPAVGAFVAVGTPLGEIVDVGELVLSARVPERDLLRLRQGMPATVAFPSNPELADLRNMVGHVRAIDAVTDVVSRRGTVEIDLPGAGLAGGANGNPDGAPGFLPVGLFAIARIAVEERAGAIWIDRRHLVWRGADATCFVMEARDGGFAARERSLVLAEEHGEGFLVASGLAAGDLLITGPLDRVGPDVPCLDQARIKASDAPDAEGDGK